MEQDERNRKRKQKRTQKKERRETGRQGRPEIIKRRAKEQKAHPKRGKEKSEESGANLQQGDATKPTSISPGIYIAAANKSSSVPRFATRCALLQDRCHAGRESRERMGEGSEKEMKRQAE